LPSRVPVLGGADQDQRKRFPYSFQPELTFSFV
jgi:hypothetical protein